VRRSTARGDASLEAASAGKLINVDVPTAAWAVRAGYAEL
jgi:hypothetical protein